jgi:hypothetical protein
MKLAVRFGLGLIAVAILLGGFLFWLADPFFLTAPDDQRLVSVFQSHRAAFERLRQMAIEDDETYLSASGLGERLSAGRRQEYLNLLSEIRSGIVMTTDAQVVRFHFAGGGLSAIGPGWSKGIEYLPGDLSQREGVVSTELNHPASLSTGEVYLRMIEAHWFIFFQNID